MDEHIPPDNFPLKPSPWTFSLHNEFIAARLMIALLCGRSVDICNCPGGRVRGGNCPVVTCSGGGEICPVRVQKLTAGLVVSADVSSDTLTDAKLAARSVVNETSRLQSQTRGVQFTSRLYSTRHNLSIYTLHNSSFFLSLNPLECRGNYSATSNNMKLVHWSSMGGLLHLVQPTHQHPVYQSPYCCIMIRCFAVLMCP